MKVGRVAEMCALVAACQLFQNTDIFSVPTGFKIDPCNRWELLLVPKDLLKSEGKCFEVSSRFLEALGTIPKN